MIKKLKKLIKESFLNRINRLGGMLNQTTAKPASRRGKSKPAHGKSHLNAKITTNAKSNLNTDTRIFNHPRK